MPFFKTVSYPLGVYGFIVLTWFVIVGSSNAVNLTDGLDAWHHAVVMVASALGVFAYVTAIRSTAATAVPAHSGQRELLVFCAAMAGAGLAFLWFNTHPAQVFMGRRRGAVARRGALGTIAVITRQEIVLGIMGGVFVVEALSVMLQVTWFKYTRQAPRQPASGCSRWRRCTTTLEKSGWKETQVVVRFWIITMLLCLVGLASPEAALMNNLHDLDVLVLGLGDSGLAMARWCVRHGARVRVWDSRETAPHEAALAESLPQGAAPARRTGRRGLGGREARPQEPRIGGPPMRASPALCWPALLPPVCWSRVSWACSPAPWPI